MKIGMKEDMGVADEMTLSNVVCARSVHVIVHDAGLNTVIRSFSEGLR